MMKNRKPANEMIHVRYLNHAELGLLDLEDLRDETGYVETGVTIYNDILKLVCNVASKHREEIHKALAPAYKSARVNAYDDTRVISTIYKTATENYDRTFNTFFHKYETEEYDVILFNVINVLRVVIGFRPKKASHKLYVGYMGPMSGISCGNKLRTACLPVLISLDDKDDLFADLTQMTDEKFCLNPGILKDDKLMSQIFDKPKATTESGKLITESIHVHDLRHEMNRVIFSMSASFPPVYGQHMMQTVTLDEKLVDILVKYAVKYSIFKCKPIEKYNIKDLITDRMYGIIAKLSLPYGDFVYRFLKDCCEID